MTQTAYRHTIHHRHHGWDHSFAPAVRISPGESLEFDVADASGGQLRETSTVADVGRMDFGRINPVCGPVFIEGARPGDVLQVTLLGFAPSGWDSLTKHLQRKGFEFKELEAAGLSRQGRRGPMDRFHRRLLWPIRTSAGEVIGFGARRLFDDDPMEAKYVNTPETFLYKKSGVLFGLDLAKRDIAKGHQAVVRSMARHDTG